MEKFTRVFHAHHGVSGVQAEHAILNLRPRLRYCLIVLREARGPEAEKDDTHEDRYRLC